MCICVCTRGEKISRWQTARERAYWAMRYVPSNQKIAKTCAPRVVSLQTILRLYSTRHRINKDESAREIAMKLKENRYKVISFYDNNISARSSYPCSYYASVIEIVLHSMLMVTSIEWRNCISSTKRETERERERGRGKEFSGRTNFLKIRCFIFARRGFFSRAGNSKRNYFARATWIAHWKRRIRSCSKD